MHTPQEQRPGAKTEALQSNSSADFKLNSSLTHADELRTNYAVHVVATRLDGLQVGQTFATLAAAERKIARQRERGLPVQATLVRLVPLPWNLLGQVAR